MKPRRLIFVASVAAMPLGGCGLSNPMQNPEFPIDHGSSRPTNSPEAAAALSVGERYALAARAVAPAQLQANYARQLQLSGPPLRGELSTVGASSDAEIRALEQRGATTTATIDAATVRAATPGRVVAELVITERTVSTGSITQQQTTYRATVRRDQAGAWRVTAFTATP